MPCRSHHVCANDLAIINSLFNGHIGRTRKAYTNGPFCHGVILCLHSTHPAYHLLGGLKFSTRKLLIDDSLSDNLDRGHLPSLVMPFRKSISTLLKAVPSLRKMS